nr:unnamed protein product [Digitaria exilis]
MHGGLHPISMFFPYLPTLGHGHRPPRQGARRGFGLASGDMLQGLIAYRPGTGTSPSTMTSCSGWTSSNP